MIPATLGLGHPGDYQTGRPCPQFVKGARGLGGGVGELWLMYFQRALWSSASRGECKKLGMGGGSRGVQEGAWAFCTSPQRGSAPGAFWAKLEL